MKPVFRQVKTLKRDLMQVRNRTQQHKQRGVVYEVLVRIVRRCTYVGETKEDTESQTE